MAFEVVLRLDDDETADHEGRRLVLEAMNLGRNFFPEEQDELRGIQLLGVFKDHRNPLFEEQLIKAAHCLAGASESAGRAAQQHRLQVTLAEQREQGLQDAELVATKDRENTMAQSCEEIRRQLLDARGIVWKWYRELHAQNRARVIGAAAVAAMAEAPQ